MSTPALALPLMFSMFTGCPESPELALNNQPVAPNVQQGPPGGPPADGTAPPPADGAASPPGDGSVPAGPPTEGPEMPMAFAPAGLASLATDGKTITLSGTITGAKEAQVDFVRLIDKKGDKAPEVLEVVRTADGTFSVKAPATLATPIYVVVNVDKKGDGIGPGDTIGFTEVSKIEGKDIALSLDVSAGVSVEAKLPWSVKTMVAPKDGSGDPKDAPALGAGTPLSTPPGSPPPTPPKP